MRVSEDTLTVDLMDGRTISVPLVWYPRLLSATPKQRSHWKVCAAGYGIHWPDLDEDLSTESIAWRAGTSEFGASPSQSLQSTAKSASRLSGNGLTGEEKKKRTKPFSS